MRQVSTYDFFPQHGRGRAHEMVIFVQHARDCNAHTIAAQVACAGALLCRPFGVQIVLTQPSPSVSRGPAALMQLRVVGVSCRHVYPLLDHRAPDLVP